jgi:hypothetical protein
MDNRKQEKLNRGGKNDQPGDLDRKVSSNVGEDVGFGQNIGRSEDLIDRKRQSPSEDSSAMESESGRDSGASGYGDESDSGSEHL